MRFYKKMLSATKKTATAEHFMGCSAKAFDKSGSQRRHVFVLEPHSRYTGSNASHIISL
jgi:hypothetical protein